MTKRTKKGTPKTILKLPDLEHTRTAALNSGLRSVRRDLTTMPSETSSIGTALSHD